MELWSIARYARELKPRLSARAFEPARSRLLWLPLHLTLLGAYALLLAQGQVTGLWRFVLVPAIGFSFAGITFLAHETLHGAVVRSRLARRIVGFLGFLPFMVSPKLWVRWHNQVHHGNANAPDRDPDAFPTLSRYQHNPRERWVIDHASVGRKRLWGVLTLLLGFTFHSAHILVTARSKGLLSAREWRVALSETALGVAFWAMALALLGPLNFMFFYLLPVMISNAIVMAYILTNHSLSPHTEVNDPLINSLSVTVPWVVDWLTLDFGFHVEHHVFPWMSTRHGREVRRLIRESWPERYQSMPLWRALWELHRTSRVYADAQTLIDPHSGKRWATLGADQPTPSSTPPATGPTPTAKPRVPSLPPARLPSLHPVG